MIFASARDITERKALEEQLAHQAFHDSLTDLPNRALFMDRSSTPRSSGPARRQGRGAVCVPGQPQAHQRLLGARGGDRLLVAVAKRLRTCLPPETRPHAWGNEFTILLEGVTDTRDATWVASLETLQAPFDLEERRLFTSASIGIVLNTTAQEEAGTPAKRRSGVVSS
jgi:GGDEF domain-containing protein